jgi:uncharacterized protein YdaU (DUF1376 family)
MLHYYTHNIGDYRRDTSHLTLLEHGVYRQMLDQYYLNEVPLTSDIDKLCRFLSVKTKEEKDAVTNVLQDFFDKTEDGYVHKRCDTTIQDYQKKIDSASKAAKARWSKESMPTHSERIPIALQTNNHKPITINQSNIEQEFDIFWKNYLNNKTGKGAALKAWKKKKPPLDACLKALEWQKHSKKTLAGYIPLPATWINQERWLDEPERTDW